MIRLFDYIFLVRPTLLIPGWTFLLLGYNRGILLNRGEALHQPFLPAFLLSTFMMGGIYILNQIIDIESDKINKKLYLLSEGYVKVSHAWIELILLFVIAFVLVIPYSNQFKTILFLSFIFGILYSTPPFKLKGKPFLDFLSNSIGYGVIAFALGWVIGNPLSKATLLYSLPYFFAIAGVFINTTIPDIEGDKQTKEITTGVVLGKKSYLLSTVFVFISFVLSVYLCDWVCGVASMVALPLFLLATINIKRDLKYCFISTRVSAPVLPLLVGFKFGWFIPLLVLVVLAMRLYYKHRFNIIYPKIT
jgi:4-hydroxybenzoate polyprenyltransferase